jgi:hypothetical protein
MIDRPDSACMTHRPPTKGRPWAQADPGYRTCSRCHQRIHEWLSPITVDADGRPDSIPGLYAMLSPLPGVGGGGQRRAPGFGSRSPANDHILAIRDKRSKSHEVARDGVEYVWDPDADNGPNEPPGAYIDKRDVWYGSDGKAYREETNPVLSVPHLLGSWVQLIAEQRDATPGNGDVAKLCSWLDKHLDWITRQDDVAEFADDLRTLHSQLRAIGQKRSRIGECPNTIDTGDTSKQCNAALYAPLYGDSIKCWAPDCGRVWHRPDWEHLGRLLQVEQSQVAS